MRDDDELRDVQDQSRTRKATSSGLRSCFGPVGSGRARKQVAAASRLTPRGAGPRQPGNPRFPMYPLSASPRRWPFRRPTAGGDTHVSTQLCWPWDLDPWIELNNGRTLTLYDLGRLPLSQRTGLKRSCGTAVGADHRRVGPLPPPMRTFDDSQIPRVWDGMTASSTWSSRCGRATSLHLHVLIRSAIVSAGGMVPPAQVMAPGRRAGKSAPARMGDGLDRSRGAAPVAARPLTQPLAADIPFPGFTRPQNGAYLVGSPQADLGLVLLRLGQPTLQHVASDLHLLAPTSPRSRAALHGRQGWMKRLRRPPAQVLWG